MTTSRLTTSATLSHGLPKSRSSASCTTKTVAARGVECFRRLWSTGANASLLQVRRRACTRCIPATSRTSHSRVQRRSAANGSTAGCAPSAPTSRTSELRSMGRSHEKMPTRRLLSSARWVGTGGSPGAPEREVVGCVSPWSALGGCRRGISPRLLAWAAFLRSPGFVAWGDTDDPFGAQGEGGAQHVDGIDGIDGIDGLWMQARDMFREAGGVDEWPGIETAARRRLLDGWGSDASSRAAPRCGTPPR